MDLPLIILTIATYIVFLIGFAGLIIPFLPGVPIIWLGALVYSLFTGFDKVDIKTTLLFTGLTFFSIVVDYTANLVGAKKYGAGTLGIIGSFIGMIVGVIAGGPIGLVIGTFAGAVIGELIVGKESRQAMKAGFGALVGFLGGIVVKFAIGLTIVGMFTWKII